MGDLKVFEIPLEKITLVRVDINNQIHKNIMNSMRDYMAREMCYDVHLDVEALEKKNYAGRNCFLVKNDEDYFGYMHISDDYQGERTLAYIVQEKLRGKGLGKVMLTSVSDYLLDSGIADSVNLYIDRRNSVGRKLAISCGFERRANIGVTMCEYSRKK